MCIRDRTIGDWVDTANGVSFGQRTVVVSWPAVDGEVQLISDREIEEPSFDDGVNFPLPQVCETLDPELTVDIEDLSIWADQNQDIAGIAYFAWDSEDPGSPEAELAELAAQTTLSLSEQDELAAIEAESEFATPNGVGVLQVLEDQVDEVRAELTDGDLVPCVVGVEYSMQQLEGIRDQLEPVRETALINGSGIGSVDNRVELFVAVADLSLIHI